MNFSGCKKTELIYNENRTYIFYNWEPSWLKYKRAFGAINVFTIIYIIAGN